LKSVQVMKATLKDKWMKIFKLSKKVAEEKEEKADDKAPEVVKAPVEEAPVDMPF